MSDYFTHFSKYPLSYKLGNTDFTMIDITKRFVLSSKLKSVGSIKYEISDGDRPDTVAFDYYERSSLDWLVLLANDIIDPYFGWYMGYYNFHNYIVNKYGSIDIAHQTPHSYIMKVNDREIFITEKTYNNTPVEDRILISKYNYENSLNEEKKTIRLIRKEFVSNILDDIKEAFRL